MPLICILARSLTPSSIASQEGLNMKRFPGLLSRSTYHSPLVALCLLALFLIAVPARAEGGIAMSGSFYQQAFEIPQGSSVSGPDVYVVVFNNSSEKVNIRMAGQAPYGVRLVLSREDFTLPPAGQMQVQIGIEVGNDAAPGQYEISVMAEPYKENVSGIQLAGAASQQASLIVTGESGHVDIQAMSPDNQPVAAVVRLYRLIDGKRHEVAYSDNGTLQVKVAPGTFMAASFVGGNLLAEQELVVAAGDNKKVILSGATIYFEGFDIVPNYRKNDGKLAFIQIVYTIKNLYQRIEKGEVFLQVSYGGLSSSEVLLATLSPLETGRAGLNYNYLPVDGWADGIYDFKLKLNVNGKHYADSLLKNLEVSGTGKAVVKTGGTADSTGPQTAQQADVDEKVNGNGGSSTQSVNMFLIGGIIAAVLVIGGLGAWFFKNMRR